MDIIDAVWKSLFTWTMPVRIYAICLDIKESFMRFYGFSEEKAEEAVWKYREYFANGGLLENEVYPGIPKLLEKLTKAGYTLAVATSKPEVYTKQILEHFDLEKYFTWVQGSSLDGTLVEKSDVIRKLLLVSGITEKEQVVMIGDRMHDIYGGQSQGIDTIGVLYGFGDRQELEAAGAGQIAETVEDLGRILL
jgi:phosphoglycolate phosphatase